MPDVIDMLAGIGAGSALDSIRATRPQARENAQRSFELLFEPSEPGGFPLAERYAVAAYTVGLQASSSPALAFYTELLEDEGDAALAAAVAQLAEEHRRPGPYGSYKESGLMGESEPGPTVEIPADEAVGQHLAAALEYAHLLSLHPRDAAPEHLRRLESAGWSADDIVTLGQLVSFLSFQIRVVDGLLALNQEVTSERAGDPTQPQDAAGSE